MCPKATILPLNIDRAIQDNFIAYLRLFGRLPGIELHEEADITWFISTRGAPGNHVVRTELDPQSDLSTRLGEVLDAVGAKVDRLDWSLYPTDFPAHVGEYLAALGLKAGQGGPWMVADLEQGPAPLLPPPDLALRRVTDAETLATWHRVSSEGFEMTFEGIQPYHDAYLQEGFGPAATSIPYIGYVGHEAVTSGTLLCAAGLAGIYDVSTPPHWRRRGYGAAITALMMEEAQARGYRYACLMASPEGERVYRKLGFELRFRVGEYIWQKSAS